MYQKITAFLALLASPLFLFADVSLRVTTATTDLAALVRTIGGDRVEVHSLVRPLQDPHYLDATPGMVVRLSRSDLVVENGVELEIGWLPEVLSQTRNRSVRPGGRGHLDASRNVDLIQVPERVFRDQGDVHPSGNPHYTLDLTATQPAAESIASALIRLDRANREIYQVNLQAFRESAEATVNRWREKFEPFQGEGIIVYHRHFDYLTKNLGLEIVDTIEPLPGLAPSARHIADLMDRWDGESVRLILIEPWHDPRVTQRVAEHLGVPLVVGCPAVGSCDETEDLISLFEANAAKLLQALEE